MEKQIKKFERLREEFGATPLKIIYNINDLDGKNSERYPYWYLLEFGRFCYKKGQQSKNKKITKKGKIKWKK